MLTSATSERRPIAKVLRSLCVYVGITRPANVIITALSVGVAAVICSAAWREAAGKVALACVSAALIAAGGNVYNDYCDRELDQIQKPQRPLPAGKLSPRAALKWAWLLLIGGSALAVVINLPALTIAALAALLLLGYSRFWKRQVLIGNLVVAWVAALAFIYGGIAVGEVAPALWAAGLAFLFHFGREIVKDLEDQPGDAQAGAITLPVRFGDQAGRWTGSVAFLSLILFLPLPYWLGTCDRAYLLVVLIGVLPVFSAALIWIWISKQPRQFHALSLLLKLDMLVGLLALYLGRPNF